MKLHKKYGFILGGACQRRIMDRKLREEGAILAWNDVKDNPKCVEKTGYFYKVIKLSKDRGWGKFASGEEEIGYLRCRQDVLSGLIVTKKKFRLKHIKIWCQAIASMEFGVSIENPFSMLQLFGASEKDVGKFSIGMCPPKPNDDHIYNKMFGVPIELVK